MEIREVEIGFLDNYFEKFDYERELEMYTGGYRVDGKLFCFDLTWAIF